MMNTRSYREWLYQLIIFVSLSTLRVPVIVTRRPLTQTFGHRDANNRIGGGGHHGNRSGWRAERFSSSNKRNRDR